MTKLFISGISGKMGHNLVECAKNFPEIEIVGGFDIFPHPILPTFSNVDKINVEFDCIIDFSRPINLDNILKLATARRTPVVFATTGYSDIEQLRIVELSKLVPVFQSGNMSVGINVLNDILTRAIHALGENWDVEVIEKHHKMKVDSPSGTAKMIANAASAAMSDCSCDGEGGNLVCGRFGNDTLRVKGDIGISSIRGGTIVGEHDVMLIGDDEILTISHTALSRKIFANGALRAGLFIADKSSGMFNMSDMLSAIK